MSLAMALVMATQAAAAAPPAVPASLSVQALFERADAAYQRKDFAAALVDFSALEQRFAGRPSASLPLVRLRKGSVLAALGRSGEAALALRAGLDGWKAAADPGDDRLAARIDLARIEEAALDLAAARRDYEAALVLAADRVPVRLTALIGIGRSAMFDDAPRAVAALAEALALAPPGSQFGTEYRGQLRTLYGRALVNRGDYPAARKALEEALREMGGLTRRVSQVDVITRGDLAIAAMLGGDAARARELLAYTGAGLFKTELVVADLSLPACGGAANIRPDDVVVVQFVIRDDGSVGSVDPIYASRQGPVAVEFARAVARWSWTPEEIGAIEPFFRSLVRLELRCTTVAGRPDISALISDDVDRWLAGRTAAAGPDVGIATGSQARALPMLRDELARRAAGGDPLAELRVLIALMYNPVASPEEVTGWISRARAILADEQPPASVRALLALRHAGVVAERMSSRQAAASGRARLGAALADPVIAADPRATAALRLAMADALGGVVRQPALAAQRVAELRAVAEDGRLAQTDPFRVGALVRLASAEAEAGRIDAARAAYQRSGLSDQQCSLVDATPSLRRNPSSVNDYPVEELLWGFSGWVQTEFDITAEGLPRDVRVTVAYPPLMFGTAARGIIARSRYTQSYRPAGGLGCGGNVQRVRFSSQR